MLSVLGGEIVVVFAGCLIFNKVIESNNSVITKLKAI
jgi:hypothetical protein